MTDLVRSGAAARSKTVAMRDACSSLARLPRAWSRALWSAAGSAQARNLLLVALVAATVVGVDQLGRMARALATVGDAQRIAGYALMRQLQAAGLGPGAARAPAEPPRAIDPARLGAPAAAASSGNVSAPPAAPAIP
jgi:hypothetical protein